MMACSRRQRDNTPILGDFLSPPLGSFSQGMSSLGVTLQQLVRFVDVASELFALRAIANAPIRDLVKITKDPMGAWKSGDMDIIRKLANLELREDGLSLTKKALI